MPPISKGRSTKGDFNAVLWCCRVTAGPAREEAATPPAGPIQRVGEARGELIGPTTAQFRPYAHADHRRGKTRTPTPFPYHQQ